MTLWDLPALDVRPVVTRERAELLTLLPFASPKRGTHYAGLTLDDSTRTRGRGWH